MNIVLNLDEVSAWKTIRQNNTKILQSPLYVHRVGEESIKHFELTQKCFIFYFNPVTDVEKKKIP